VVKFFEHPHLEHFELEQPVAIVRKSSFERELISTL
jgi:hypothetical protein